MGVSRDMFGNRVWQCQDINWAHAECVGDYGGSDGNHKCKGYKLKKGQTLTCKLCNWTWHRLKDL